MVAHTRHTHGRCHTHPTHTPRALFLSVPWPVETARGVGELCVCTCVCVSVCVRVCGCDGKEGPLRLWLVCGRHRAGGVPVLCPRCHPLSSAQPPLTHTAGLSHRGVGVWRAGARYGSSPACVCTGFELARVETGSVFPPYSDRSPRCVSADRACPPADDRQCVCVCVRESACDAKWQPPRPASPPGAVSVSFSPVPPFILPLPLLPS